MKRLVLIILAVCTLYACKEHKGYTIMGELDDANGIELILMKLTADSEPVEINSCTVRKGKFQMKGMVDFPEYCILYAGDNGPLQLFVENAVIKIAINLENIQESKVTGSRETDLLMEFFNTMTIFEEKASKINEEYMTMLYSGEEPDEEKQKEIFQEFNLLEQSQLEFMKQIVDENPNSIFTAILVQSALMTQYDHDKLEDFISKFDEVNLQSHWVQEIVENVETTKRFIGQPFIDIRMPSPDGNEIALSDYAGKGKYVLIDFWASWCQPCRVANPYVVELYNKYKDKGFEIVGVSLDQDREQWIKAIADDELAWPQMSDLKFWLSEGAKSYAVSSIPHTVLLDKDGKILARGLHLSELEEKLAELFED